MTPEQLKASILQYAIQGKLVEQRPEEGTADELYEQIQEEKRRLIREGKIKKEKPLAEFTEDEIPFDIPESWKWIKLGDCSTYSQTKEKIGPSEIMPDMWSLDLEDIQKETGNILVKRMACERKITGDKVKFHKNQVLYSKLRPYLKKILVAPEDGICTPELVPFDTYLIDEEYLVNVLKSPYIDYVINSVTYGVKMPRVGTDTMTNLLIPLPPLCEQKRIVTKIEQLLPYVERYTKAYEKLEQFNAKFPEDMKKSILQYAIQGKLVEQRPEEGTAEELYQKIQEEKQKLIREGKIKKEKSLTEIAEDEIPFDIPENWKWVRLGQCVSILGDGIHGTPRYTPNEEYHFINGNNLSDGHIVIRPDTKTVSRDEYEKYQKELTEHTVFVSINGTIGNVAFYNNENIILGKSACYFNLIDKDWKEYIYWIIKSDYFLKYAMTNATGSTIKNVSLATMKKFLVPLPPLEEQHRIVAKIKQLLPYCNQLIK